MDPHKILAAVKTALDRQARFPDETLHCPRAEPVVACG
jgi:hypothetical protein